MNFVKNISPNDKRLILGMMSGTSCDGISCALIEVQGLREEKKIRFIGHYQYSYPKEIKEKIFKVYPPNSFQAKDLVRLHHIIGEVFADVGLELLKRLNIKKEDLFAISAQGPILYHDPPSEENNYQGAHMEIGESAVIADRLETTTVMDLRAADIAGGGHGAPLSVYVDYILFKDRNINRAVQNIGGIANVTFLHKDISWDSLMSFDCGPGNMLIDYGVRYFTQGKLEYDVDGNIAKKGKIDKEILSTLMDHPYIKKKPPKTTGRELFGEEFFKKVLKIAEKKKLSFEDIIATLTAFTVEAIAYNYEKFYPKGYELEEVILGGGGTYNKTMVEWIKKRLNPIKVKTHEDFGIPNDAREAITWAVLADEMLFGVPNNVPSASGAKYPVLGGKISLPPFKR
ncbi:MAG: anhydro-N-acetylmuramic acid kinase [Dictyoglomaceae bacterium]|nr:anhydro-N-acetylmuramic acid kinase [Dictyoglomaceae bacterium]